MVMAMAMVLGMSLTTFAADVNIKLQGMENAQKIEYAQVIVADQSANSGWSFVSDDVATEYARAFGLIGENGTTTNSTEAGSAAQTALWKMICYQANYTKTTVPNLPDGMNQTSDAVTEDLIRKALGNAANTLTYTTLYEQKKDADGEVTNPDVPTTISVGTAGIYAVRAEEEGWNYQVMAGYVGFGAVTSTGSYPTLTGTTITAKKSETSTNKTVTDNDKVVAIGDIISYSISVKVPYINPTNTNKTFTVTDEIKGATYYLTGDDAIATVQMTDDDVSVMGGSELFVVNDEGTGFSIDLSELINDENSNAGKEVTVTYTAKVTETTVENTAQGHAGGSDFSSSPDVKVYSGNITLTKYGEAADGADRPTLAGAGFEVYETEVVNGVVTSKDEALKFVPTSRIEVGADGTTSAVVVDGDYTYAPDATEGYTTEVFTGENGTVVVRGLNIGTYHFEETTAPEGYSINTAGANATLTITGEATAELQAVTDIQDTVLNALPSTGGIGTTIFTIGGVAIMVVAAGLFFATRKKASK